ncbi:hypothetical protein GCM10022248_05730 [Nonomuraea soli]
MSLLPHQGDVSLEAAPAKGLNAAYSGQTGADDHHSIHTQTLTGRLKPQDARESGRTGLRGRLRGPSTADT